MPASRKAVKAKSCLGKQGMFSNLKNFLKAQVKLR